MTGIPVSLCWNDRVLEKELASLIQKKDIPARIDSHNKVLYARHADQRAATFAATLKAGQSRNDSHICKDEDSSRT